jgi:hypothetical protein
MACLAVVWFAVSVDPLTAVEARHFFALLREHLIPFVSAAFAERSRVFIYGATGHPDSPMPHFPADPGSVDLDQFARHRSFPLLLRQYLQNGYRRLLGIASPRAYHFIPVDRLAFRAMVASLTLRCIFVPI